jgi:tetratricopeptide (TPR) repeat protein
VDRRYLARDNEDVLMRGKPALAVLVIVWSLLPWLIAAAAPRPQRTESSSTAKAEALIRQGNAREALALLLEQQKSSPGDWQVCHLIGLAYTQQQKLDSARDYYRKALALNSAFLPARKNLAIVLWFLEDRAASEREFHAVAKAAPADPVPQLYLGLAAHGRSEFQEARRRFQSAGDLAMTNPEVLPAVIESFLGAGDPSVPRQLLQKLEAAQHLDAKLAVRAGMAFARFDMDREAVQCIEKGLSAGASGSAPLIALGEAYDRLNDPEKALAAFRKAIEADPSLEDAYLALAHFSYLHQNNEYALKILDQGLARTPRSARLLHQRGVVQALLGNHEEAEKSLREAVRSDPASNASLLALGVSQLERGLYEDAAATFRQSAAAAPSDFRPEYLYALALKRGGDPGRRDEILLALQKAASLKPGDARPHASLGQAYLEAGRSGRAAAELEEALRIDPENTTALFHLGRLYRDQGKPDEARRMIERFEKAKARQREEEGSLVEILKIVTEK